MDREHGAGAHLPKQGHGCLPHGSPRQSLYRSSSQGQPRQGLVSLTRTQIQRETRYFQLAWHETRLPGAGDGKGSQKKKKGPPITSPSPTCCPLQLSQALPVKRGHRDAEGGFGGDLGSSPFLQAPAKDLNLRAARSAPRRWASTEAAQLYRAPPGVNLPEGSAGQNPARTPASSAGQSQRRCCPSQGCTHLPPGGGGYVTSSPSKAPEKPQTASGHGAVEVGRDVWRSSGPNQKPL